LQIIPQFIGIPELCLKAMFARTTNISSVYGWIKRVHIRELERLIKMVFAAEHDGTVSTERVIALTTLRSIFSEN
jgi:hypothetical protein